MEKTTAAFRRDLHRIPELGFDLPKTTDYIERVLKTTGARIERFSQGGLLAYFDAGKEKTRAFRADMDALPTIEQNETPYASSHPGKMHACGHDAHMAMLLSLARYLHEHGSELSQNILLIFQPAEETGGGAVGIAQSGVLEKYRVQSIFALHVMPGYPLGALCSRPGPLMAQSCEIHASFQGRALHITRYMESQDALFACADFVARVYAMERALKTDAYRLLRFGMMRAGTAVNVTAETATVSGTLRSFDNGVFEALRAGARAVADDCEKDHGVTVSLHYTQVYPALINDEALYRESLRALSGHSVIHVESPALLSEDFSHYQKVVPGVMFWLGLGDAPPLHAANFDFDERALDFGVEALVRLAKA